jgi:hypothetical protein
VHHNDRSVCGVLLGDQVTLEDISQRGGIAGERRNLGVCGFVSSS